MPMSRIQKKKLRNTREDKENHTLVPEKREGTEKHIQEKNVKNFDTNSQYTRQPYLISHLNTYKYNTEVRLKI